MSSTATGRYPHAGRVSAARLRTLAGPVVSSALSLFFFGEPVINGGGTCTAGSDNLATGRASLWSFTSSGGFTLGGGTRSAVMFKTHTSESVGFSVACTTAAHKVMILLRGGEDGRTGFEVGIVEQNDIDGLGGTNNYLVVRRVQESKLIDEDSSGSASFAVPQGGSVNDVPSSGGCFLDVSATIPDGVSFTMDARVVDGTIEVRLNGSSTPSLSHSTGDATYAPQADTAAFGTSATGALTHLSSVGFVSAVSGARVLSASVLSLDGVTSAAEEVLVAVGDGDVWATRGESLLKVADGYFPAAGTVQMVPFGDHMDMLGPIEGSVAKLAQFSPVTLNVKPLVMTAGTLPGATATPGTTSAQVAGTAGSRFVLAGFKGDEANALFLAVDDDTDCDTGSELPGRAYDLAGTRPLKLGHPIVAIQQSTNSATVFGCSNSMHSTLGDPVLGNFDTNVLSEQDGISGEQSMVRINEGRVIGHGPNGLFLIPPAGQAANFSDRVLKGPLQLTREQIAANHVIVARDPQRQWLVVCFTPRDGSDGTIYIYDETEGGYSRGTPGYYPISFPASMQPTRATLWRGALVFGCADGRLRSFADGSTTDDGATPIESFVAGELLVSGRLSDDARVRNIRVQQSAASGQCTVTVYGAETAEKVYAESSREALLIETVDESDTTPIPLEVRAPALLIELANRADQAMTIEGMTADVGQGEQRTKV